MASLGRNQKTGQYTLQYRFKGERFAEAFSANDEAGALERKALVEAEIAKAKETGKVPEFIQLKLLKKKRREESDPLPSSPSHPRLPRSKRLKPDEFIEKYLAYIEADVDPSTHGQYRWTWKSFASHVEMTYVSDLTAADIQEYKSKVLGGKKPIKPVTLNNYLKKLKVIFNWGHRHGYLLTNPMTVVKPVAQDKDPKPYLTKPEIDALLKAAGQVHRSIFLFCCLGVYAGLRPNEIINARWNWFHLPQGQSTEDESIIGIPSGSITVMSGPNFRIKNRQARTIPLHRFFCEIIVDYMPPLKEGADRPEGFYVCKPTITDWNPKTKRYRWDYRCPFNEAVKAAGIEFVNRYGHNQKVNAYTLRHTFASHLAQNGHTAYEIQQYCGHSDIKISEGYMHLSPNARLDW